jgi:5'-methylthioadenosine phosphorylase
MKTNDVIGLGNAMMDFLVEVDDVKLVEFGLQKGEMHLVEEDKAKEVMSKVENFDFETSPGGSAANTLKGVALLGGKAILCAKVGQDVQGDNYVQALNQLGVDTRINKHSKTTGHCVSFVTPDTERTMSTHLGAALELYKEDILENDIACSKILHLEGYQLEGSTRDTVLHAIELAKRHNTLVSIDLADPGVIRRNKEFLHSFVSSHVDIVFVNEKEALEFTGLENEDAARALGKDCKVAVVKIGKEGSFVFSDEVLTRVEGVVANAIDTTGAGDSYAAGFLYGFCNNWPVGDAGKLGSLLASKIVEQKGAGMKNVDGNELKNSVRDEIKVESKERTENLVKEVAVKSDIKIGIIGGSGLDNPDLLQDGQDKEVDTPYGKTLLKFGNISGVEVILLARHGRRHTISPTQVNNRANIHALKEAGCTHILATTACGSLREEISRGDFVILDQFIDFTRLRKVSFFEEFAEGKISHTPMADPFDSKLRGVAIKACEDLSLKHHDKGCVVTIEGPRFSTRAESNMFRAWGADVINMSIAPECVLANEIGIPYAAIAMSTDYDCWKVDEVAVTWEEILQVFKKNVEKVTALLINVVREVGGKNGSENNN